MDNMIPIEIKLNYIPVYHSSSSINGVGVFTPIDIEGEEFVGASHVFYGGFWYMTTHGNYNHSENPNCIIETEGNINLIIANMNIAPHTELTVDYRNQPYLEQPKESWKK